MCVCVCRDDDDVTAECHNDVELPRSKDEPDKTCTCSIYVGCTSESTSKALRYIDPQPLVEKKKKDQIVQK